MVSLCSPIYFTLPTPCTPHHFFPSDFCGNYLLRVHKKINRNVIVLLLVSSQQIIAKEWPTRSVCLSENETFTFFQDNSKLCRGLSVT